jgi:hypothetical protein
MELPDRSQARSWEGKDVLDSDGSRLGRCVGVFADTATGQPEWLHIDVEGHVRSFVPAIDAVEHDGGVRVRFSRSAVLGAPSVGDDVQLSKAEEIELYRHYGVPVESGDGSVLPADAASTTGTGEHSSSTTATTSTATTSTAVGTAAAAGAVTPVAGLADRSSTAASSSSGADTSVAESDADVDGRLDDRTGDTAALTPTTVGDADAGPVPGGAVTPETGAELPVLDPAAASTQVPEGQVTYVDQPEGFVDDGADVPPKQAAPAAEPEQPRPTLRRVPPASPPPAPAPSPAPSSSGSAASGSAASALTPLGAVAGVAAAVALVLRARDRRARRRSSAAARAGRLGDSLRAGSAVARTSASNTLAGVAEAAELTRRSAATATSKAAKAAAQQQQKAASASRRQRSQTASVLAVASKTATEQKQAAVRSAAAQRKAARKALAAAAKTAAQQRKAARTSLTGASRTAARRRKAAAASLTAATSRSKADSVAAVPAKVAKRGRKARRSLGRKLWNLVVLGAGGGGYVLGAKAGRQRYDELSQVASAVAESPQVQSVTEAVTDPQRRADLLAEVQQQASSLVGRRGEPRA